MRVHRIHHPEPLADEREFRLTADAAKHLVRVLRLRAGDRFTVFDGSGREWPATLLENGRARTGTGIAPARESGLAITLVQAITRGERMDLALQKSVELGVAAIQPVFSRRSEVRLTGARLEKRVQHWQKVVVAACEQSGRVRVPRVAAPVGLEDWVARQSGVRGWLLDPAAACALTALDAPGGERVLLAGPEGGFEDTETRSAAAAGLTPVRLGPRILRAETAGVAALAVIQSLWGDLGD